MKSTDEIDVKAMFDEIFPKDWQQIPSKDVEKAKLKKNDAILLKSLFPDNITDQFLRMIFLAKKRKTSQTESFDALVDVFWRLQADQNKTPEEKKYHLIQACADEYLKIMLKNKVNSHFAEQLSTFLYPLTGICFNKNIVDYRLPQEAGGGANLFKIKLIVKDKITDAKIDDILKAAHINTANDYLKKQILFHQKFSEDYLDDKKNTFNQEKRTASKNKMIEACEKYKTYLLSRIQNGKGRDFEGGIQTLLCIDRAMVYSGNQSLTIRPEKKLGDRLFKMMWEREKKGSLNKMYIDSFSPEGNSLARKYYSITKLQKELEIQDNISYFELVRFKAKILEKEKYLCKNTGLAGLGLFQSLFQAIGNIFRGGEYSSRLVNSIFNAPITPLKDNEISYPSLKNV